MNQKNAKRLRRIFNPQEGDEVSKKSYRVAKKHFKKLPQEEKAKFIKNLETIENSTK